VGSALADAALAKPQATTAANIAILPPTAPRVPAEPTAPHDGFIELVLGCSHRVDDRQSGVFGLSAQPPHDCLAGHQRPVHAGDCAAILDGVE
jgi:hypothetical protein